MVITAGATSRETHTDPFGTIPTERIDAATLQKVCALRDEVLERSGRAADANEWHALASDEEFLRKLDRLRSDVGALWLKLWRQLDEDIEMAHRASGSLWRSMWVALIRRQLRPQKYRAVCGTPSDGYGALVTCLANLPAQEQLMLRWHRGSWKEHVDKIWRTKSQLIEKEKEYREAAIAVAQIGIGVGGMLLGLLGLAISIAVPAVQQIVTAR